MKIVKMEVGAEPDDLKVEVMLDEGESPDEALQSAREWISSKSNEQQNNLKNIEDKATEAYTRFLEELKNTASTKQND